ncbi:MAG TPA: AAA family ATPase [Streptosporangiaceae bacterium]|nr:AAA family ATPase [Streptosporangiaceae bacterium]
MLVWINGPFGGGKTAAAFELRRRVDRAIVCDPERLGYGLHRMLPPALRTDFQDFAAWRQGVHEVLDLAAREWDGPVIVPMTLVNPRYFEEMVGRLRAGGHDVRHFSLLADRATVLRRLRGRGFGLGLRHEQWAVTRLDECLGQLQDPLFATHVHTDDRSVPEVAEVIARSAGLAIRPDTDGVVRARLRRYRTSLAHIHLG